MQRHFFLLCYIYKKASDNVCANYVGQVGGGYKYIWHLANFKTILNAKGSNETMHGKCLNYKVFLQKESGTYFYECIYNKTARTKKTQAKSLGRSSAGLSSCCESLAPELSLYLAELQLHSTSVSEGWCGTAVQQLACTYPRWWHLRNQLSNCFAMCCLRFAKTHHSLESFRVSPELGGENWCREQEQWVQAPEEPWAGAGGGLGDSWAMEGPSSHREEKHCVLFLGGSVIIHFAVSVP